MIRLKGKGSGWKGESRRHSLARKGIRTNIDPSRRIKVENFVARGKSRESAIQGFREGVMSTPTSLGLTDEIYLRIKQQTGLEPDYSEYDSFDEDGNSKYWNRGVKYNSEKKELRWNITVIVAKWEEYPPETPLPSSIIEKDLERVLQNNLKLKVKNSKMTGWTDEKAYYEGYVDEVSYSFMFITEAPDKIEWNKILKKVR